MDQPLAYDGGVPCTKVQDVVTQSGALCHQLWDFDARNSAIIREGPVPSRRAGDTISKRELDVASVVNETPESVVVTSTSSMLGLLAAWSGEAVLPFDRVRVEAELVLRIGIVEDRHLLIADDHQLLFLERV